LSDLALLGPVPLFADALAGLGEAAPVLDEASDALSWIPSNPSITVAAARVATR
jgi:hypothetical protein